MNNLKDCPDHGHCQNEGLIEDLRSENAKLKEILDENAREIILREMHFEDGTMEMYLQHPLFALFAGAIVKMWVDSGAKNYLEIRMSCEKIGFVTVTVQREMGKTPHQLREEAEARTTVALKDAEDLKAKVALMERCLNELLALSEDMARTIKYEWPTGNLVAIFEGWKNRWFGADTISITNETQEGGENGNH